MRVFLNVEYSSLRDHSNVYILDSITVNTSVDVRIQGKLLIQLLSSLIFTFMI